MSEKPKATGSDGLEGLLNGKLPSFKSMKKEIAQISSSVDEKVKEVKSELEEMKKQLDGSQRELKEQVEKKLEHIEKILRSIVGE